MKKTDDDKLFKLMKAMSEDETAFFRKHFLNESSGKDSAAARLFELLRTEATYDEGSILRTLEIKPESLPVIKSNLYSDIIDSLRISAPPQSPEREVSIMIEQAEVLIAKNLFKEAMQLLLKAEELAMREHAIYHTGIIKSRKIWLSQFLADDNYLEKTQQYCDEIIENANDILLTQRIYNMCVLSTTVMLKANFGRNKADLKLLEKIVDNDLFRPDTLQYHHKNKLYLLVAKAHYCNHRGEFDKAYEFTRAIWEEVNRHREETGKESGSDPLNACMELITAACNAKKFKEAGECFEEFKHLVKKYYPGAVFYEGICLYFECLLDDFVKGVKLNNPEFKKLVDFSNSKKFSMLPPAVSRATDLLIADIFFSNKEFEKSLVHSKKLAFEKSTSMTRIDQLTSGRILHLMAMFEITYESKGRVFKCKDTLMHVRAKQFYETVRKLEDNYQYERLVFRFFMHLPEKTDAKELAKIFEKHTDDIDRLKSRFGNEYMLPMLLTLDIQKWIGKKLKEYKKLL